MPSLTKQGYKVIASHSGVKLFRWMGEEEKICRFCFEEETPEKPLIAPCACKGGQKYVHLDCIRRWQRMVLVEQPTHPLFYRDSDLRHQKCQVCNQPFNCPPPTRFELMQSFTGPALAALINQGCIIAASETFSDGLRAEFNRVSGDFGDDLPVAHWVEGVYFIAEVSSAEAVVTHDCLSPSALDSMGKFLNESLQIRDPVDGTYMRVREISASQERRDHDYFSITDPATLKAIFASGGIHSLIEYPAQVTFERVPPPDCGCDHIVAVNLTRHRRSISHQQYRIWEDAKKNVASKYRGAQHYVNYEMEVQHYIGGPCKKNKISMCFVLGGRDFGFTIVRQGPEEAIKLSLSRGRAQDQGGDFFRGQEVTLNDLKSRTDLNGERGILLGFNATALRWQVLLRNGEKKEIRSDNLSRQTDKRFPKILIFWGCAQWSRTQLLGEIARAHWGLCKMTVADILEEASSRRSHMGERLIYAPKSEMVDHSMEEAATQMQIERERNERLRMTHGQEDEQEREDDE